MKMTRNQHRWIGLQNALFYVLFLAVMGVLAYLSHTWQYRADWTFGQRNSLSEASETLLTSLDQSLQITAYIPDDDNLKQRLRHWVSRYQYVKSDTTLEFVNPDLEPQRAKQDGVEQSGQLLLKLGEEQELINSDNESVVLNALMRLSRGEQRIVVFLEGHNERQPLWTGSNGMSTLTGHLEKTGFKLLPFNLLRTRSLPDNASFVVLAAPQKPWLEGEVDVLIEYVKQGGNLLWLHDPRELGALEPLAELLGVQMHYGTVVDANEQLQALLGIQHPAVVPVVEYGQSEITRQLNVQTFFPFATLVSKDPRQQGAYNTLSWKAEEFLWTLPQSWLEADELDDEATYNDLEGDQAGPISIGVSLKRQVVASNLPLSANDQLSSLVGAQSVDSFEQRIVVIGDSDFMLNGFVGHGGNLELAQQVFNWLSRDDRLLALKSLRAPDTYFEMDENTGMVVALFFLMGLPGLLLTAGVGIWWWRRQR